MLHAISWWLRSGSVEGRGEVEGAQEEAVLVDGEFDAFRQGHAGSVAGADFDAEEDGRGSVGCGVLEFGGVLEGVGGEDAVVVVGGHDEGGGVGACRVGRCGGGSSGGGSRSRPRPLRGSRIRVSRPSRW